MMLPTTNEPSTGEISMHTFLIAHGWVTD
jgi:hypothetical protein